MPSHKTPGRKGVYIELEESLLAEVQALAKRFGRGLKDEVQHAIRRHLAQPPTLAVPNLEPATAEPVKPNRGRPKAKT